MTIAKSTVMLGLLLAGASAWGQGYTPPPPPLTTAPCVPTKKDPCTQPNVTPKKTSTEEAHPFPGEPGTADAGKGAGTPGSAADAHPFPGEPDPAAAAEAAKDHPFPGEPPASSSSSSSNSGAGTDAPDEPDTDPAPRLKDQGSSGSTRFQRRHLAKVESKDDREGTDLEVSKYYMSTGDYRAAYLRARDAVASVGDDPEAHMALAESAQKFGKPDEARAEYEEYLKLEPDGVHAKAARKALAALAPK